MDLSYGLFRLDEKMPGALHGRQVIADFCGNVLLRYGWIKNQGVADKGRWCSELISVAWWIWRMLANKFFDQEMT